MSMRLHFEDWSSYTNVLDRKGISHGGRIIKIYTGEDLGRFRKQNLVTVESSDEPFGSEVFDFGERGKFTGRDIENAILARTTNKDAARIARSLLRFSLREDTGFVYAGMQVKVGERFLINNPLDEIDGWEYVPAGHAHKLHLDIFVSSSLERLRGIVNFDDSEQILTLSDLIEARRKEGLAGNGGGERVR